VLNIMSLANTLFSQLLTPDFALFRTDGWLRTWRWSILEPGGEGPYAKGLLGPRYICELSGETDMVRGGRSVNLSSISARGGFATQTVYTAWRAAVEGPTKVWPENLAKSME
jgi:NAD(P)-dependent dehydrogenase (short-subunit alcohol dehydrogenase family)